MSEEPEVRAHLGKVLIPRHDSEDGWTNDEYTPEAARVLVRELLRAAREAVAQRAEIVLACADGHEWGDGFNLPWGERVTVYHCTREGCEGRKEEPGWLPFEPKQHRVMYRANPVDCTGPGCDHCSDEIMAEQVDRFLTDAFSIVRGGIAWPQPDGTLGEALGGSRFSPPPAVEVS